MSSSPTKPLDQLSSWKFTNLLALAIFLLVGTVYIGKTWSPSSYGYVLTDVLGYADSGPAWGKPRSIRSDEYAVVTPLTQATVNNGFARINRTSLYGEDLRINYGLPIRDWGLLFKPTMWLYGLTNPAYAYSLHWFVLSALFVFGYAWLFRWLGTTPVIGFTLAAGLYFTGFVQFWWSEKGPIFALFPWVILPFATRLPIIWQAALFYWLAVAWLLTNFYPPIQISLAFVALVILLAREPKLFRPWSMALLALTAALAAGTAAFYLGDYLRATATTIYPGSRIVSGGDVAGRYWLSWLFPAVNFDRGYQSLVGANICETGTVGMYYFLLAICYLDFAQWRQAWSTKEQRRLVAVLAAGLALMLAWMALPLPSWIGAPLLWNHVQPGRMQYAGGVLLICLVLVLVQSMGLRITRGRFGILCLAILVGYGISKHTGKNDLAEINLAVVLLLSGLALAFARFRPNSAHTSVAMASLLAGMFLFGRFNPLQPAWPIFNHLPNNTTKAFDRLAADNDGVLAVTGLQGAVGNGLGYRSLSHVTAVPQLAFWRKKFPNLPNTAFEMIFNRYSHIVPRAETAPRLLQGDALIVPVNMFQNPAGLSQKSRQVRYLPTPGEPLERNGVIDRAAVESDRLVVSGWGPWTGPLESHELEVTTTATPLGSPTLSWVIRPDLPPGTSYQVSALNGFSLDIPLGEGGKVPALCLVALDASTGKRSLLHNPPEVSYCQQLQRSN